MRVRSLLLALAFVACTRTSGPSDDYAEASRLWSAAVTEKGDEAASDPRADEALALAMKVPANSIDSDAATALVKRIESARAERAELAKVRADAPVRPPEPPAPSEAPGAAPPPAPKAVRPVIGEPAAAVRERYGDCLVKAMPFVERGGTRQGEALALVDSATCKERHPELVDTYVFVLDDKVFNVAGKSAAVPVVASDGGWAPLSGAWPDAGVAAPDAGP